jgi:hypothetical protein
VQVRAARLAADTPHSFVVSDKDLLPTIYNLLITSPSLLVQVRVVGLAADIHTGSPIIRDRSLGITRPQ